jgi:phosphate transport system permease protein
VRHEFGVLPFVYGTLVSSALALLIAVPLGLGVAIFLAELVPGWLRSPIGFFVELLAAIPSVVIGLWGIFVLVPWVRGALGPALRSTLGFLPLFSGPPLGIGMLTAGLILAVMVVPFIVAVSTEVMRTVPRGQREAALALGATGWETTRTAVLPYARSGIIGAIFLALARALGETMAVTMVIGNVPQIKASLFAPAYTIPAVIANEFAEATSDLYVAALIYAGLVLFIVTVIVNALARLLVSRVAAGPAQIRE